MSDEADVFEDLTRSVQAREDVRPASGAIPFWGEVPEAWDSMVIAGIRMPGLVKVSGGVGQRWDTRHTPGKDGMVFTILGYEAAKISITLTLWTERHLRDFETLVRKLRPRFRGFKGKFDPSDAVPLEHPSIALFGIAAVVITELGIPEVKGQDVFEVKVECIEYIGQDKFRERKSDAGVSTGVKTTKRQVPDVTTIDNGGALAQRPATPSKPSTTNVGPIASRGATGGF